MQGYIYKTTNLINGKIYIGQHGGEFTDKYFGSGKLVKEDLLKYGTDNFSIDFLAWGNSQDELDLLEKRYIADYRKLFPLSATYNINDGGPGCLGRKPSKEWKQAIRKANLGRKASEETRKKLSLRQIGEKNCNYGRKMPQEEIDRLHARAKELYPHGTNYGKKHSPEAIRKMVEAQKRYRERIKNKENKK